MLQNYYFLSTFNLSDFWGGLQDDVKDRICEKSYRGHPLTEKQKENNKIKSHTRCLVEHIFGFMECVMNKLFVRTIGIARAKSVIGMNNLIYNMFRYEQIVRLKLFKS